MVLCSLAIVVVIIARSLQSLITVSESPRGKAFAADGKDDS